MSEPFRLETAPAACGVAIVRVHGELDVRTAPRLLAASRAACADGMHLVLNLAGVPFIASSGIGALLALVEEFRQRGARVRVAAPSPAVDASVQLLHLERFLEPQPDEATAVASLAA